VGARTGALEGVVIGVTSRGAGPFNGAYKGKTVLVTGHTGFKGSWLSLWLSDLGANVVGYATDPPTDPSAFAAMRLGERITDIRGDVRDAKKLATTVAEHRPDAVFHLAAQALVRPSYDEPAYTYETNVMGVVHLFEAVRATDSVSAVVNVTSDKCYENREWVYAYREIDPMGGYDPYSSSKGCAELVTSAYRRSFFSAEDGPRLASVRAGNVIGGGDWAPDRIIPDVVRAVLAGQSTVIRNPSAVRPWQHVLESLSGYLELAERLHAGDARFQSGWNFGPRDDDAVPVSQVLDIFCASLGERARWHVEPDAQALHEAKFLHLDITKARTELGWEPRWSLRQALEATAHWYSSYMSGADMREVSLRQIAEFERAGASVPARAEALADGNAVGAASR
jgi:CDP-glucose 4,6-dehydratase